MRVISIANHKGGCGKTATVHALGDALAAGGLRVLMVDLDPDASLTQAAGLGDCRGRSVAEVLGGHLSMRDILHELRPGWSIAPSSSNLAEISIALVGRAGRENALKKPLSTLANLFDLVLIDTAPSLSVLTVAALTASDAIIIPSQAQAADLRGVNSFLATVNQARALNPKLAIMGVLVTFYDNRLTHHKAAVEAMQAAGLELMPVMVGRSVRVAEAAAAGQSIITYDPGNPQAQNYLRLSEVVKSWLENNQN